ncbi:MAG: hypothetical protein HYX68_10600 [Planctomycetes bacterium]|nr:hypothetical protein [Planctomycetota bacterium]
MKNPNDFWGITREAAGFSVRQYFWPFTAIWAYFNYRSQVKSRPSVASEECQKSADAPSHPIRGS